MNSRSWTCYSSRKYYFSGEIVHPQWARIVSQMFISATHINKSLFPFRRQETCKTVTSSSLFSNSRRIFTLQMFSFAQFGWMEGAKVHFSSAGLTAEKTGKITSLFPFLLLLVVESNGISPQENSPTYLRDHFTECSMMRNRFTFCVQELILRTKFNKIQKTKFWNMIVWVNLFQRYDGKIVNIFRLNILAKRRMEMAY